MAVYLLSEGKYDKIFLPAVLKKLDITYCPLKTNDTKSLTLTDRDYYQDYQYIVFADNGRSDIYTKIMRRFILSFFKKEPIQPIHVLLFLDDDYSLHNELTQTLHDHITSFAYLIPQMESECLPAQNCIRLQVPSDPMPRISIQIFYVPHSLEWQIVQAGLQFVKDQKMSEQIAGLGPHKGLELLSLNNSSSIEEIIRASVTDNWLDTSEWYGNLLQILEKPNFTRVL
jgi:hypothetical protein